jgi:hypothetical protein
VLKGKSLSLDSASVSIANDKRKGAEERVDLPMRAFAGGFYNNLKAMYDHLGVQYHNQPFLFEFANVCSDTPPSERDDTSYFVYASNLHKIHVPWTSVISATAYMVEALYLLVCYTWFTICCFLVAPRPVEGIRGSVPETLSQYLKRIWLPEYFTKYYLLPLISSVTTCPHQSLLSFPASDLIDYKKRTHRTPHYTVSNGVKTVQDRLAKDLEYELEAMVTAVKPLGDRVELSWTRAGFGEECSSQEVFDRVILAIAPDVVGKIYKPLHYHMSRIPTMQVESIVHTDQRHLRSSQTPVDGRAQLIHLRTSTTGVHRTESLHVQPSGAIVTTCPFSPIDPSLVIHTASFTRVLRNPESKRLVNSIFGADNPPIAEEKALPRWRNGDDNVWLVGGWCWDGMVLLEGCVVSAMRVAKAFDVEVPWSR